MNMLDLCVIVAASPRQAALFDALLRRRQEHGLYPRELAFLVCADPEGGRVGSGGGTLNALRHTQQWCAHAGLAFPDHARVLVIHAGGESRHMPCYAPEGKLFAPVPVDSSSIVPPVMLDLQLRLFLNYPWKAGEVIITSGDVVIDFDTAALADERGAICGFAKPVSFDEGARHGVFKFDRDRLRVTDYFQKASPAELARNAVLEGSNECALDMGIIALQPAAVRALLAFGAAPYNAKGTIADAVARGAVAFDLYLELLSACLPHLDFARYSERLAGRSPLPPSILRALFDAVHPFTLTAQLTRATTFLHFGNLPDFAHACRELHTKELHPFYAQEREELRVQCTPELVQFNAINIALPTRRGKSICVENADGVKLPNACGNNLFFGLREWSSSIVIPEGICLDMRTTDDGTYTLVYGVHDTFKPAARLEELIFCGCPFDRWLRERGLTPQDVWDERDQGDLLAARLFFPEAEDDFIAGYWRAPVDGRWGEVLLKRPRVSLAECNARSDAARRDAQRMQVRTRLLRDLFQQGMGWKNCSLHDLAASLDEGVTLAHLRATCAHTDDVLLKVYRQAHVTALAPADTRAVFDAGFAIDYLGARDREPLQLGVKEDQIVWARAPLRLDLAGGWSDTPPYTLRHGGQVVNLAVNLNGQPPIQVFCRRTATRHIVLHSIDLGVSQCIAEFAQLENYGDPSAVFALPKAALCLLGFTHAHGTSLDACLAQLGSGLELTVLCAVPKGSGLGTSSILTGVILAALHRFLGRPCLLDELFRQVLQIEQMLTTGGGWQDQIGGIVGGVKYIESKPGLKPSPVVHQLDPFLFAQPDARACMTLFYTGITRLAKNILGDVVAQVNYNTPAYLFTLDYLRHLAREARDAISLRSLPRLATIISTSWQANKRIHASTTNDEVERLMQETAAHYSGVKLLGAGGGGYALFISPDATQAEALRALLHARFENNKARIVDMALNLDGLQVSVS